MLRRHTLLSNKPSPYVPFQVREGGVFTQQQKGTSNEERTHLRPGKRDKDVGAAPQKCLQVKLGGLDMPPARRPHLVHRRVSNTLASRNNTAPLAVKAVLYHSSNTCTEPRYLANFCAPRARVTDIQSAAMRTDIECEGELISSSRYRRPRSARLRTTGGCTAQQQLLLLGAVLCASRDAAAGKIRNPRSRGRKGFHVPVREQSSRAPKIEDQTRDLKVRYDGLREFESDVPAVSDCERVNRMVLLSREKHTVAW